MNPKFIIVGNEFLLGHVELHYELAPKRQSEIIGGGWWYFLDEEKTELLLFGASVDFGHVTTEQIEKVFTIGILPQRIARSVEKIFHSIDLKVGLAKENKKLLILRTVTNTNS